ncbi:MAG: hypothetical protein WCO19_04865 [Candidatus Saccharibacteria bacterium]
MAKRQKQSIRRNVIVGFVVLIGLSTLLISQAQVPTVSFETESGDVSGCAQRVYDTSASAENYVKFGAGCAPAMLFDATRSLSNCTMENASIVPTTVHNIFALKARATNDCDVIALTTSTSTENWWPRVSHDGTKFLYYRTPQGVYEGSANAYSQTSLRVMNIDGSGDRELIASGRYWPAQGHAEWSPDDSKIVMFGGDPVVNYSNLYGYQIYVTDANGGSLRQVTKRALHGAADPSWSPDGQTIVFASCPDEVSNCTAQDAEIVTVPATSTNASSVTRITENNFEDADAYWSPDGSFITWISKTGQNPVQWGIYKTAATARASAGTVVMNDGNINSKTEWSEDSQTLYFHRYVYGQNPATFKIYSLLNDGSDLKQVKTFWKPNFNADYNFPSLIPS